MENVKVTVYLSTYNQAPYITQALDSILMQKTTFPFEILVADDCSTDDTQKIVLEYQERYPEIIRTYFTPVNVGGCKKLTECIDKGLFRGEYLSYLEGDDYWLGEDRLQVLVNFLDAHPEYSRVAHRRKMINEKDEFLGLDTDEAIVGKTFGLHELMEGYTYSDFGSVFRNYFKQAKDKYHPIFLASRNAYDFQDLFITQDFGPVYVMDRVFGVYRCRSVAGESNYNSIMSTEKIDLDKIHVCRVMEEFYQGKYDLSPRILTAQRALFQNAVLARSAEMLNTARGVTDEKTTLWLLTKELYLAKRGKHAEAERFVLSQLSEKEKRQMPFSMARYVVWRAWKKLRHEPYETERRANLLQKTGE